MRKFGLMILAVIVALGARPAFTHPEKPPRPERRLLENAFALAGEGFRIGVVLSEVSPQMRDDLKIDSGVLIREVLSDSPAEKAGLKDGDVIVRMDGKNVETEQDIRSALRNLDGPKDMSFEIVRDGKPLTIVVTPEKREYSFLTNLGGNFIGVDLQEMDEDLSKYFQTDSRAGILVARVERDSPAEKAGLRSGDVVTEINGVKINTEKGFRQALDDVEEGESAELKVLRHGKVQSMTVKPESRSFQLGELDGLEGMKLIPEMESLRELRNLPRTPEFRESMQDLKREMEQLKREMDELKDELQELRKND